MFNLLNEMLKLEKVFSTEDLLEGIASVRRNYLETNKISQQEFEDIKNADPTEQKKYMDWIAKMYTTEKTPIDELKDLVGEFHEAAEKNKIENKDINQYKSFDDLDTAVGQASHKETRAEAKARKKLGYDREAGKADLIKPEAIPEPEGEPDEHATKVEHVNKGDGRGAVILRECDYFKVISTFSHESLSYYGDRASWCVAQEDPEHYVSHGRQGDYFYVIEVLQNIVLPNRYQPGDTLLLDDWSEAWDDGNETKYFEFADAGEYFTIQCNQGEVVNIWDDGDDIIKDVYAKTWMAITEMTDEIEPHQPYEIEEELNDLDEDNLTRISEENYEASFETVENKLKEVLEVELDYEGAAYRWFTDGTDAFIPLYDYNVEDFVIYMLEAEDESDIKEITQEYLEQESENGSWYSDEGEIDINGLSSMEATLVETGRLLPWTHSKETIRDFLMQSKILSDVLGNITLEKATEYANSLNDYFEAHGSKVDEEANMRITGGEIESIISGSGIVDTVMQVEQLMDAVNKSGFGATEEDEPRQKLTNALANSKYSDYDKNQLKHMDKDELLVAAREAFDKYKEDHSSRIDAPGQMKMDFAERRRLQGIVTYLNS